MKFSRILMATNIALILLCMFAIFKVNQKIARLDMWVMGLQETAWCTSVKEPCAKCGCNIYNTLVYNFDVIRRRCAKCGEPHAQSLTEIEKFWDKIARDKLTKKE